MNVYYLAGAVLVVVGIAMLATGRYVWSLPMFGAALALYFISRSLDSGANGGGGHA